jgi:hypothetical protein
MSIVYFCQEIYNQHSYFCQEIYNQLLIVGWFMVYNATFNIISVISLWSVLLVEETGEPGENHWPVTSHWQTLSHNVVLSTPRHERGFELATLVVIGTDCTGSCKSNYHNPDGPFNKLLKTYVYYNHILSNIRYYEFTLNLCSTPWTKTNNFIWRISHPCHCRNILASGYDYIMIFLTDTIRNYLIIQLQIFSWCFTISEIGYHRKCLFLLRCYEKYMNVLVFWLVGCDA